MVRQGRDVLVQDALERSCPSWLRIIPPPQESGKMAPYYTIMRGRYHDSAPRLLPAGGCGTPLAMLHTTLRLEESRRIATYSTILTGRYHDPAPRLQPAQALRTPYAIPPIRR